MPEEIGSTIDNIKNITKTQWGDLIIYSGEYFDNQSSLGPIYVSVAWSGWGKVSAARAVTRLLATSYKNRSIDLILFIGLAGAADQNLKQWDLVISSEVIQHDMDARPLYKRYEIPALRTVKIKPLSKLSDWAYSVLQESTSSAILNRFGNVSKGLIATGDSFISEQSKIDNLSKDLPGLLAVEMEGAAVAQVAAQEGVEWLIIRVISDGANDSAAQNFNDFLKDYEKSSWNLIEVLLTNLKTYPLLQNN